MMIGTTAVWTSILRSRHFLVFYRALSSIWEFSSFSFI